MQCAHEHLGDNLLDIGRDETSRPRDLFEVQILSALVDFARLAPV